MCMKQGQYLSMETDTALECVLGYHGSLRSKSQTRLELKITYKILNYEYSCTYFKKIK